ncbi:Plant protein of unknown function (DUF247) [Quillaja saponaria]|uniref:Uncharacterized protein n=1 Tax=Quillaja saponaria TaxID=32244 RepID=A0AAD7LXN7_QUISA|nr:Plant protein of unknown function (DUF247) [Quillaja saponaria]
MEPCKVVHNHDHEWVIDLSRTLEEDLESHINSNKEDDDDHDFDDDELVSTVSIFNVPKTLISSKQEAYTPQVISLGPYHHRRLELFEMERYKLTSAKQVQKNMKPGTKFRDLVDQIVCHDVQTRACYHRYLDFDHETLAWMFAMDASFLLEYLQTFCCYSSPNIASEGSTISTISSVVNNHLMVIDYTRRRTMHQEILRDVIMLENQIPLFLLREVHGFYDQHDQDDQVHELMLVTILMGFAKYLAPIKYLDDQNFKQECLKKSHLLELVYDYIVVPKLQFPIETEQEQVDKEKDIKEEGTCWFSSAIRAILQLVWFINWAFIHFFVKMCRSKIARLLITLPWKVVSIFFNFRGKTAVNSLVSVAENVAEGIENSTDSTITSDDENPLVEELAIPSVRQLSKIGVKFHPSKGGLSTIKFDKSSGVFHLPVIHLNDNSDVVLRNLVAYEASVAPEAMVFTRYTELMNGIIDTEKDVRILAKAGILKNRMKNDKEVASLWNGMTKSINVTKVPVLDKAIECANEYYSTSWKVKMKATMKKYVYNSWPCLTFLAANVLIWLSIVETVCSVYQCSKFLNAS